MPPRRNEMVAMIRQEPYAYYAVDSNSDSIVEYEAWAEPGAALTDQSWIVCKHTYSGNILSRTQWAQDSAGRVAQFTNAVNDITNLTYV